MSEHPAEDLLELLALRRLPAESRNEIFFHLQHCPTCQERLRAERHFADTIRVVLKDWPEE
jgi:hypothetical protein